MSSVRDIIIIAVLLFAIGISIFFSVKVGHSVNAQILNISIINDSAEAKSVINHADIALDMSDYIYLACFIGFFIAIIVTGYIVGGMPIMAPIYFFLVVLFTFVSVLLQNVWTDIANSDSLITIQSNLPITYFILTHLGYFMAIFGIVGIIMLFAKPREVI